ncbi:DctP family TRAP transporter solute-binding subunit [bacterium]|nr:DctP family TRAP transporter solute-binding subunit [bacterium]
MRRNIFILIMVCCIIVIISCRDGGEGPRELKLSLILGNTSDWYRGAARFAELVGERTGGAYKIRIFPHAQLAGQVQRTELEMVQSGVIDMSLESTILLSLIERRMSVFSMPWLFDDYEEVNRVLDGPLGKEILGLLPEKRIMGLAYGANGFRQVTNSRNPIRTPEDIAAMKIRVPGIRMYIDIFKLLGADPSSMNFGELFTALAQKTMDGQENPVSVIFSSRLYEVQRYLTMWNYSYDPVILCVNKRLWDSLSPETREIFTRCAQDAMRYERGIVADGEPAIIDSLKAKGMEINSLTPDAIAQFRKLAEPLYAEFARETGNDLVKRFRDAVK